MIHGKLSYPYCAGPAYTLRDPRIDGFLLPTQLSLAPIGKADRAGSNLDATESSRIRSHMLLSFQRPPAPSGGDSALRIRPLHMRKASVEAQHCSRSLDRGLGAWHLRGLAHPKGPGSIALRRRNVTVVAQSTRKRTKRRLPTCSTTPSRRSAGTSRSPAARGSPSTLTPP